MADLVTVFNSIWIWISSFLEKLIPVYILPNLQIIIQVVILLVVAYIAGRIGKWLVKRILGVVGLRRATAKGWADSFLRAAGYKGTFVELIGDLVKWLIYILFLALIIQTIGLPGVAEIFTDIAVFMPRFIGAILLIVIGFILADFIGKIFEEAGMKFLQEEALGKFTGGVVKYSIALVVIIMALALLGLDTGSLLVLFSAFLGIIIVILILGIRDYIPNITAGLHLRSEIKVGDKIGFRDHSGVVEKITPITTTLKTQKGRVTIPNYLLIKEPIQKSK